MNVLSLFNGMSCINLALERADIEIDKIYTFEIDKYCLALEKYQYPDNIQCGDVLHENVNDSIDILVGGSPCTYWSISNYNRETTEEGLGFDLFMQFKKALDKHKPKYFIYENNYRIHKDIVSSITLKLGVEPILINSALVSAQGRKRYYWTNIPTEQPEDRGITLKDIITENGQDKLCIVLDKDYIEKMKSNTVRCGGRGSGINDRHNWDTIRIGQIGKGGQGQRIYHVEGKSVTLTAKSGGQGAKTGLYVINDKVRRLSVIECERLQTVPDNFTQYGNFDGKVKNISDSQRYKMLGNGWTVDVISWILQGIPQREELNGL